MWRGQFTFYRSYYEAIRELPKKEQTVVLLAICSYALDEAEPKLTGTANAIFTLIRPTLDASKKKADAGKAGGSVKRSRSKHEAKAKQTEREIEKENEEDVEREIEIEKENENECYGGGGGNRACVPTYDQILAYAETLDKENPFSPQFFQAVDVAWEFWAHYNRDGWMIGTEPVRDWKALFRTWRDNELDKRLKGSVRT